MTPRPANEADECGEALQAVTARSSAPANPRSWLRTGLVLLTVAVSLGISLFIAYELAMARVPQHRAALERLVRAHTGLDVSFNELGLRWGWYGPEAVFRRVELGEPGRSNVVVRAPQLVVGFDLRRTLQTGQLAAGRVTLVAPDIDLERLLRGERPNAAASPDVQPTSRVRFLRRWRGGRIDIEGGTLRLPDPHAASGPITVHVRRASLRRSGGEWNGFGLVFLPERLGRTARVVVQLRGDLDAPQTLSGGVRFEGTRLAFAGWRDVLAGRPRIASSLPASGNGDVSLNITVSEGRLEKADGEVKAADVTFALPPWVDASDPVMASRDPLTFEYVSGAWRFVSRNEGGQLQIDQLALSRDQADRPLPRISMELSRGHVHGSVERVPLASLLAVGQWLAPDLVPAGVTLKGNAEDLDFDWNTARPEGARLALSAQVTDAALESPSAPVVLSGLSARISGTERRIGIEIAAPDARIDSSAHPERPLQGVHIASVLDITPGPLGWQVSTDELRIDHSMGQITLKGSVAGNGVGRAPRLNARGTIEWADIERVRAQFEDHFVHGVGGIAARLTAGRVERASFRVSGPLDALFASREDAAAETAAESGPPSSTRAVSTAGASQASRTKASDRMVFAGTAAITEGRLEADGAWPAAEGLAGTLEWSNERMRARVSGGRAGAFEIESLDARWDASGERVARIAGRAQVRVEDALEWWRAHPDVQEHAPQLRDLVARGNAVLDFEISVPPASAKSADGTPPKARTRVAATLENVEVPVASGIPPIESLRGSMEVVSGRLQRSTLNASWLGGPLMLRLSQRRDRDGGAVLIRAQGFIDAQKLVAFSQLPELPEITGQTPWTGEFVYSPSRDGEPAQWHGRADSTLVGVASALPAPLAKNSGSSVPLHIEISGAEDHADVRATLAGRVRALFALQEREASRWELTRGAIRAGAGAVEMPAADIVSVRGHLSRLDLPAYAMLWHQLPGSADVTRTEIDLTADELVIGDRVHTAASLQATPSLTGADVRIHADTLGAITGTLTSSAEQLAITDLTWNKDALRGEGNLECRPDLASCEARFELVTDNSSQALADLGFRPELSAAKGSLRGELAWQPRTERPWLETLTGRLSMRFEDGVVRQGVASDRPPFALLTVPALLSSITPSAGTSAVPQGDLHFRTLAADFELAGGGASTSNLHLDGDAEILMRGRTDLVAHDYDHEAWVLRGEERIPSSVRRLASAPRVAAAWLALRELLGDDESQRSRVVLHLQGSWEHPSVMVD
ncbi:MAG: hypothetical protein IRZ28_08420 [Steroidobacteraceae bacterium]|nr:hypothetical protein [Steroidobacteraceae bacterium]